MELDPIAKRGSQKTKMMIIPLTFDGFPRKPEGPIIKIIYEILLKSKLGIKMVMHEK